MAGGFTENKHRRCIRRSTGGIPVRGGTIRLFTSSAYVFCTALDRTAECRVALQICGEEICICGEGARYEFPTPSGCKRLSTIMLYTAPCAGITDAERRTCAGSAHALRNAVRRRRAQPGGWGGGCEKIQSRGRLRGALTCPLFYKL